MTIALVIAVLIAVFLIYVVTRPNAFRLERTIVINTPPEKPFALVNDFHAWTRWSPFEGMDEDLKRTYEGAPSGLGAVYSWDGKKSGAGRMEIVEATPTSRLLIQLDFFRPFPQSNKADFTFVSTGASTTVTWAMYGPMRFINKLMGVFASMDRMVGGMFQTGLESLKREAEKP